MCKYAEKRMGSAQIYRFNAITPIVESCLNCLSTGKINHQNVFPAALYDRRRFLFNEADNLSDFSK